MQDRPNFKELLEIVRDFLQSEAVPKTTDPHLRFRVRIAANLLGILQRELDLEEEQLPGELRRLQEIYPGTGAREETPENLVALKSLVATLNTRLAEEIRSCKRVAAPGDRIWRHVRATVIEKLKIANPAYLKRVGVT